MIYMNAPADNYPGQECFTLAADEIMGWAYQAMGLRRM